MLRSFMTISGFTLMSRVLGLLRDQIMMIMVGACAASDAYLAAFRFPNMGRRIFGWNRKIRFPLTALLPLHFHGWWRY